MAQTYETAEYAAMLRRMVRGYGKRLATGDPSDIADAVSLLGDLEATIRDSVTVMRDEHGFSWADLALELGVSRQAAHKRWSPKPLAGDVPAQPAGSDPLPFDDTPALAVPATNEA